MKKNLCKELIILSLSLIFVHGKAIADDSQRPLVPLPSVPDFSRGSGWGFALGLGVEYETAYDGSDEYEFEIEPAGAVHYRINDNLFFWEGMELGWRGLASDQLLLQAGVRNEGGLEPDDSDDGALNGVVERDSHLVGFLEARRSIGTDWRNWVGGRIMGGPSDFGWLGVIAAGHRFGDSLDGTGTEVFGFSTFGTANFINKDFGVSGQDSVNSGLAETDLDGGYRSVGITVIDRRYLSRNIQFVSQAGVELYSSNIQRSPIARKDYELEVGMSILWQF
jgi:outer membrane protein